VAEGDEAVGVAATGAVPAPGSGEVLGLGCAEATVADTGMAPTPFAAGTAGVALTGAVTGAIAGETLTVRVASICLEFPASAFIRRSWALSQTRTRSNNAMPARPKGTSKPTLWRAVWLGSTGRNCSDGASACGGWCCASLARFNASLIRLMRGCDPPVPGPPGRSCQSRCVRVAAQIRRGALCRTLHSPGEELPAYSGEHAIMRRG